MPVLLTIGKIHHLSLLYMIPMSIACYMYTTHNLITCIDIIINILLFSLIAEEGTSEFRQFLDLLGDTIDLLGWAHYKGGLDVKSRQELV